MKNGPKIMRFGREISIFDFDLIDFLDFSSILVFGNDFRFGFGFGFVRMPQKATYKTRYIIITIAQAALADSAEPKSL